MPRSTNIEVNVTFNMKNGLELTCQYSYTVIHGFTTGRPEDCYPDEETDPSDPVYFLDGTEIAVDKLPKGLEVIAQAMYDDGRNDSRFSYKEDEADNSADFDDY